MYFPIVEWKAANSSNMGEWEREVFSGEKELGSRGS